MKIALSENHMTKTRVRGMWGIAHNFFLLLAVLDVLISVWSLEELSLRNSGFSPALWLLAKARALRRQMVMRGKFCARHTVACRTSIETCFSHQHLRCMLWGQGGCMEPWPLGSPWTYGVLESQAVGWALRNAGLRAPWAAVLWCKTLWVAWSASWEGPISFPGGFRKQPLVRGCIDWINALLNWTLCGFKCHTWWEMQIIGRHGGTCLYSLSQK